MDHGIADMVAAMGVMVLFLIFLSLIFLIPIAFFVGGIAVAAYLLTRYRWRAAVAFLLLLPVGSLSVWEWKRSRYADYARAIQHGIDTAPKLGQVHDRTLPIFVHGETGTWPPKLTNKGCFGRTFWNYSHDVIEYDPAVKKTRKSQLPGRYLQIDLGDFDEPSGFGDRVKSRGRGPYELWLVDDDRRQLIDVLFIQGDGAGVVPFMMIPFGELPLDPALGERSRAINDFLARTAGQCAGEEKSA